MLIKMWRWGKRGILVVGRNGVWGGVVKRSCCKEENGGGVISFFFLGFNCL